jgi:creatinine amidohydrolase/Fe(II)-dependent formamide hydrolase-like protein
VPKQSRSEPLKQQATLWDQIRPVDMAQYYLGFPSALSLFPSTLLAVIKDVVDSLSLHGFFDIWFLNGLDCKTSNIQAAFPELHAIPIASTDQPTLQLSLANRFALPGIRQLLAEVYPDGRKRSAPSLAQPEERVRLIEEVAKALSRLIASQQSPARYHSG